MKETKVCTNCKHFNWYYRNKNGRFQQTGSGYCSNYRVRLMRSLDIVKSNSGCEFWESEELKEIADLEAIDGILRRMQKSLDEIKQILVEKLNNKK